MKKAEDLSQSETKKYFERIVAKFKYKISN